jgi:hypothetical protein
MGICQGIGYCGSGSVSDNRGGLNGSTQHFLAVYSQES